MTPQRLPNQTIALGDRVYTVGVTLARDMTFTVYHGDKALSGSVLRDVLHDMRRILWWSWLAEIKGLIRFAWVNTDTGEVGVSMWSGFMRTWHDTSEGHVFNADPSASPIVRTCAPFVIFALQSDRQESLVADFFEAREKLQDKVRRAKAELDEFNAQGHALFGRVVDSPSTTSSDVEAALSRLLSPPDT